MLDLIDIDVVSPGYSKGYFLAQFDHSPVSQSDIHTHTYCIWWRTAEFGLWENNCCLCFFIDIINSHNLSLFGYGKPVVLLNPEVDIHKHTKTINTHTHSYFTWFWALQMLNVMELEAYNKDTKVKSWPLSALSLYTKWTVWSWSVAITFFKLHVLAYYWYNWS